MRHSGRWISSGPEIHTLFCHVGSAVCLVTWLPELWARGRHRHGHLRTNGTSVPASLWKFSVSRATLRHVCEGRPPRDSGDEPPGRGERQDWRVSPRCRGEATTTRYNWGSVNIAVLSTSAWHQAHPQRVIAGRQGVVVLVRRLGHSAHIGMTFRVILSTARARVRQILPIRYSIVAQTFPRRIPKFRADLWPRVRIAG